MACARLEGALGMQYTDAEWRERICPVAAGELRIEPMFKTAAITAGFPREPKVDFAYRKLGGEWQRPVVKPVHFPEQDNWRGMIFGLEEDTEYEVKVESCKLKVESGEAGVLARGKFRTWKSEVPIARTIYLDENTKFPIFITEKGTPQGWIRYTTKSGVTLVNSNEEFYTDYFGPVNVVGAEYVVIDNMKLRLGRCRRGIVMKYSHDVRLRNLDISGFGIETVPDVSVYGGSALAHPKGRFGEPIRGADCSAILVYKGMSNTAIERCYIHDPINRSCCWRYWHPFGPLAIVYAMPDHSSSLRYNDFIGSDLKPFDDCISCWGNAGPDAGFNRAAEIDGNFWIFSSDDCLEIDGAQQNVAVFNNRFETALVGVSLQGNSVSPSYVWHNFFASMGDEFGEHGQTIKTSQFDFYKKAVYTACWENLLWGGGNGISLMHTDSKSAIALKGDSAGRIAQIDFFDNVLCGHQEIRGLELAVHSDVHGNRTGVEMSAAQLPTEFPIRPTSFTLSRVRVDVTDPEDRAPQTVKFVGGKGEHFRIVKNEPFDWFAVEPSEGEVRDGGELKISFDAAKLVGRPLFRGAFTVRLDNGLSRPLSIYVAAKYTQPERCEKPGEVAVYRHPQDAVRDAEGYDVYRFTAPKDGRYYLMGYAKAPALPEFLVKVSDGKAGMTCLQTCPDYPVWSIVVAKKARDVEQWKWGPRVQWHDLKAGEELTLRLKPKRGKCDLRALVLTDSAYSFEPRMRRTLESDFCAHGPQ